MCGPQETNRKTVRITVNKEEITLPEGTAAAALLEMRGIRSRVSVWINGKQLLLAEYETRILREGDTVKILRIVAGG